MIVLIPYICLLNLSWIKKKCLFLRNMELLSPTHPIVVFAADRRLQFFLSFLFFCTSVIATCVVLSLFVPRHFCRCLGNVVLRD